ncbi:hypothetical protein OAH12_00440 [Cyclobacteriaceae bacterium]|nr:hypothetical protein [Cyclobacteriaceae bacterium]
MKQTIKLLGLASFALVVGFSCKPKNQPAPASAGNEVEVKLYCSGESKFQNSKEFFRATATGESLDRETAKKKALSNARNYLASNINTTVKAVTDNYVNSREYNNSEEVEERFEFLSREVVNQELQGLNTICEKVTQNSQTKKFTYYVAIELSGADLLSKMNDKLSQDQRIKVDYDYEKFKETFNAEMDKMSK